MNAPAPPLQGSHSAGSPVERPSGAEPAPSQEALALRKIKIGRISFDEIWLAASREASRSDTTGRIHEAELRRAEPGSLKARQHAEIAEAAFKDRDCFFAMCRLVERLKTDRSIVEKLRDMAERENAAALSAAERALEAEAEAAQERRLNGEETES